MHAGTAAKIDAYTRFGAVRNSMDMAAARGHHVPWFAMVLAPAVQPWALEGVLMSEYEGHAFHLDDAEEQVARHLQLERLILSSIADDDTDGGT